VDTGTDVDTDADAEFAGETDLMTVGTRLAGGVDLNGDGVLDLLVSRLSTTGDSPGSGASNVLPADDYWAASLPAAPESSSLKSA